MTDSPDAGTAGSTPRSTGGEFSIKRIYCKDISFEAPSTPQVFQAEWKPDLDVRMDSESRKLGPGDYEVVLTVTITARVDGNVAFLAEVKHGATFRITGLTSSELGATLGAFCPSIIFPYTREVISDLAVRGGFPQLLLAPVNFEALYTKHLAEQKEEQSRERAPGA